MCRWGTGYVPMDYLGTVLRNNERVAALYCQIWALHLTGTIGVNMLVEVCLPRKTTWPTPVKWRAQCQNMVLYAGRGA